MDGAIRVTPSITTSGLTTLPSCRLGKPSDGKPPSRAVVPALGQEISPQWEISKFASGKEPTGLFARKHLLTPYTGEAKLRNLSPNNFREQNHAFASKITEPRRVSLLLLK